MRYIFFGTPEFAAIVLKKLLDAGLPPIALVCNPDRPVGRKKIITPPPTKHLLLTSGHSLSSIQILQPEKLDKEFLDILRFLNADFYIVAAYAKILKKDLLDIPPKEVIGVHPSLLPKYRGASPIQTAILNGEEVTGVDLFILTPGVDDGDILGSKRLEIRDQNYKELEKELAELGGELLVKILPDFMAGKIQPIPQDHSKATLTKKFKTEDGFVPYEELQMAQASSETKAIEIERKIRALSSEPGVYTIIDGKRVKLLKARIEEGKLRLLEIQKEGGKPMRIEAGI